METTFILELQDARRIIELALQEAQKNNLNVTIAVCDAGGALLCLERMDGAPAISASIAKEKAYCSAITGKASKVYEDMVNSGRVAALKMPLVPLEGAEPIIVNNRCIGAVGVSGAKPDQDVAIARAGLKAVQI